MLVGDLINDRPHTSVDKAVMRSDAAAELDRLTRSKKPSVPPDQNSSDCWVTSLGPGGTDVW